MSDDLRPSPLIPVAAFSSIATGLATSAVGLQMILFIKIGIWWAKPVPWLYALVGVALMGVAGMSFRGRFPLALLLTAGNALLAVVLLVWVVFSAFHTFFSPLTVFALLLAVLSTLLGGVSIPAARRLDQTRRELLA